MHDVFFMEVDNGEGGGRENWPKKKANPATIMAVKRSSTKFGIGKPIQVAQSANKCVV